MRVAVFTSDDTQYTENETQNFQPQANGKQQQPWPR